MTGPFLLLLFGIAITIAGIIIKAIDEAKNIQAMTPAEKISYIFGPVNEHLICPHCQTKGSVHAKQETRVITSKGKVGGIVKTNTTSQSTNFVTQHHCENCSTTWDV